MISEPYMKGGVDRIVHGLESDSATEADPTDLLEAASTSVPLETARFQALEVAVAAALALAIANGSNGSNGSQGAAEGGTKGADAPTGAAGAIDLSVSDRG